MDSSSVDSWIEKTTLAADYAGLMEYQLGKAGEAVGYAKRSCPFYAERLKGIQGGISDISLLPFTFPKDIENSSAQMLCVGQGEVRRVVTQATSGTTARAKRIFFTEKDMDAAVEFFYHGMKEFTAEGDAVLILFPGEKEGSIGRLLAEALGRLGATPREYGIVRDFYELLRFVSETKINVIAGLPQQLLELSRLCRHTGTNITGIHSVLLSADYVPETVVQAVEKNLGCRVYEHYGMTEMCFGGGVYSKPRDGYHMRHGDFLFEIVDPKTGAALPYGKYGEVVFTSLNTEAMPLIRYRTGDISRFAPVCGKYPVLEKINGRVNGGVRLSNGKTMTMSELEEVVFNIGDILDFSAAYSENALEIRVRSLRFDEGDIIGALRNSPLGGLLSNCEIKVTPSANSIIRHNTMRKRAINSFLG